MDMFVFVHTESLENWPYCNPNRALNESFLRTNLTRSPKTSYAQSERLPNERFQLTVGATGDLFTIMLHALHV